jgi:hypothetical protein
MLMIRYSYMVGGLLATVSPDEEANKLNQCAEHRWELVQVLHRRWRGQEYIFYYLRREITGETAKDKPRFSFYFAT